MNKTSNEKVRLVIVEDNETVRRSYEMFINSVSRYVVKGSYGRAEEMLRNVNRDSPHIVLMDLDLPGMDGITAIRKLRKINSGIRIIVLSVLEDTEIVFNALCSGASGYILKAMNYSELLHAIGDIVDRNGAPMSPRIARLLVESFQRNPNTPLSERETEILASLASGKTYKDTANDLNIGMETVKSHVKNIYFKLHATCKTEAIRIAREKSLI